MSLPYSVERPARVLALMPHPDDFEFNAGGAFALLHRQHGGAVRLKVVTTTSGGTGHHRMNLEETRQTRFAEGAAAARLVGAEFDFLRTPEGRPFDRQFFIGPESLEAVWRTIRTFQADLVICPPPVTDPLSGVHIDHEHTAQAVRLTAYQLGVPHAFPSEGTPDMEYRPPLIVLADDTYANEAFHDFRLEITDVYETKLAMAKQHRSQIYEWLPFVDRCAPPTEAEYEERFRLRHERVNQRYRHIGSPPSEYYRVSRWGRPPAAGELEWYFGEAMKMNASREDQGGCAR